MRIISHCIKEIIFADFVKKVLDMGTSAEQYKWMASGFKEQSSNFGLASCIHFHTWGMYEFLSSPSRADCVLALGDNWSKRMKSLNSKL